MTRVFRSGINYTSNGLNGVTLLSSLSQLITRRPIRARPAGLLFIYTHRWKWQRAGSSDQTSNTGTLQHIVPLRRAPNQHPALSDTGIYTRCRVYRVSGHPVKKDIQFVALVVVAGK